MKRPFWEPRRTVQLFHPFQPILSHPIPPSLFLKGFKLLTFACDLTNILRSNVPLTNHKSLNEQDGGGRHSVSLNEWKTLTPLTSTAQILHYSILSYSTSNSNVLVGSYVSGQTHHLIRLISAPSMNQIDRYAHFNGKRSTDAGWLSSLEQTLSWEGASLCWWSVCLWSGAHKFFSKNFL